MKEQIFKAIIRKDLDEYIQGIRENPGFIDDSDNFLESTEERLEGTYPSLDDAESMIDPILYLDITDSEAVLNTITFRGQSLFTLIPLNLWESLIRLSPTCIQRNAGRLLWNTFPRNEKPERV